MFGRRRNLRPATRLETGCVGTLFFGVGSIFLFLIAVAERDPRAPGWALIVGVLIPTFIAIIGGSILFRAVFWDGDERR